MWEVILKLLTDYGLPTALAIVVVGAQGYALYRLWKRNQELVDRLLGEEGADEQGAPNPHRRATRKDLDDSIGALRAELWADRDAITGAGMELSKALAVLGTLSASGGGATGDEERREHRAEVERYHQRIEAARRELAELHETSRQDLKQMSREQLEDMRKLTREQLQTMEAATNSIEKLSALLQGAMSRGGSVR